MFLEQVDLNSVLLISFLLLMMQAGDLRRSKSAGTRTAGEQALPPPPSSWSCRAGGGEPRGRPNRQLFAASSNESNLALPPVETKKAPKATKIARQDSFGSESAVRSGERAASASPVVRPRRELAPRPERRARSESPAVSPRRPRVEPSLSPVRPRREQSARPSHRLRSKSPGVTRRARSVGAPTAPAAPSVLQSRPKRNGGRGEVPPVNCNVCGEVVQPHERYRGFLCSHEECGLALRSAQQCVASDSTAILVFHYFIFLSYNYVFVQ